MRVAIALLLVAASSGSADPFLDHYGGGGESRSPDGRWRVWSKPPDADEADAAPAWLTGPGVRRRLLLHYERALYVTWMADRRHLVLRLQGVHLATIAVFALSGRPSVRAWRPERLMEAALRTAGPPLARIESRDITYAAAFPRRPCVSVTEAGLPAGRTEGSYVTRSANFRLDLESGSVVRVPACPPG